MFRCVLLFAALTVAAFGEPVTTVRQILSADQSLPRRDQPPIHLRGVVTLWSEWFDWFFMQDATGGILIMPLDKSLRLRPGQLVEVEGISSAGLTAPFIHEAKVNVVGQAPLPNPLRAGPMAMAAGGFFGQWVEVEGVVREAAHVFDRTELVIASKGVVFVCRIQGSGGTPLAADLVDARVIIRGVNWPNSSPPGAHGFTVHLPGREYLEVVTPAPATIFDLPLKTSADLRAPQTPAEARVRIRGRVTWRGPGGTIFLRDAGGFSAVARPPMPHADAKGQYQAITNQPAFAIGDELEVVGTPHFAETVVTLFDADWRIAGHTAPPAPTRIKAAALDDPAHDAEVVVTEGRLLSRESLRSGVSSHDVLTLQSGGTTFEAVLDSVPAKPLPELRVDHMLRVTGVAHARAYGVTYPRLYLRDAADVEEHGLAGPVLARYLTAAGGVCIVLALGWVFALRRKVARQAAEAAARRKMEDALRESERTVRELNTGLEARVAERTADLVEANQSLQDAQVALRESEEKFRGLFAREKELNDLKSSFVSMVSHEFRTPLAVILSSTELLKNHFERLPGPVREQQLRAVRDSTLHMSQLIEEVLLLGKVEGGHMAFAPVPLDLAEVGTRLIDEIRTATQDRCPIHFDASDLGGSARLDPALLGHIFTNLLSNAVKYSAEGSPVEWSIRRENGTAICTVRDHGIGIPEADLAQMFIAFHRARNVGEVPGSGLGLVIVKCCTELHGGTVEVASKVGEGTVVTVRLPLCAD